MTRPPPAGIDIRLLGAGDQALVERARGIFDHAPLPDQSRAFLESHRDMIWFALAGGGPVGFASASILLHPDKLPHVFVNELGVAEPFRRRGIATSLMHAVLEHAETEGLGPVWLAAKADDAQALAFYRGLSGMSEQQAVIFEWGQA